jgi:hypothetical protein
MHDEKISLVQVKCSKNNTALLTVDMETIKHGNGK